MLVVNQSGGNAEAVASHVLAMLLMLSKRIIQTHHALRRGTMRERGEFTGTDVRGRTIGIVGLGNVGRRVAELCRGLFGMQVIACDPYLDARTMAQRGAAKVELDELLRRADFVSINCPLDEGTRGMIGARAFALMQPHAYFITTARGHIHDERALADALRERGGEPAHGGGDARGARQHGAHRVRAADHDARRQAAAAHRQSAGVAGLCQAICRGVRGGTGK